MERRERELVEEQRRIADEKLRQEQEAKRRKLEVGVFLVYILPCDEGTLSHSSQL